MRNMQWKMRWCIDGRSASVLADRLSLSLSLYLVRFRFRSTAQRNRRYWFNSKRKMEHDIRCVWGLVHQQHQRHRRTQCAKAIYQTLQLFSTLPFTTGTRTDSIIRHHTRRIVLLDLKHFFCVCVWWTWHVTTTNIQHPTSNTQHQHPTPPTIIANDNHNNIVDDESIVGISSIWYHNNNH